MERRLIATDKGLERRFIAIYEGMERGLIAIDKGVEVACKHVRSLASLGSGSLKTPIQPFLQSQAERCFKFRAD